jgi:hypothetical protein
LLGGILCLHESKGHLSDAGLLGGAILFRHKSALRCFKANLLDGMGAFGN